MTFKITLTVFSVFVSPGSYFLLESNTSEVFENLKKNLINFHFECFLFFVYFSFKYNFI